VIVADTNVISELMKGESSSVVREWLSNQNHYELRITAITVAEILYGIERLPKGRRKTALREAAREVFTGFAKDVLPFDVAAAALYAEIVDRRDRQGAPISGYDAQIASICRVHGAQLATRNESDFADVGVKLINPWTYK
jgi:predicted nucleic acid-binding protein